MWDAYCKTMFISRTYSERIDVACLGSLQYVDQTVSAHTCKEEPCHTHLEPDQSFVQQFQFCLRSTFLWHIYILGQSLPTHSLWVLWRRQSLRRMSMMLAVQAIVKCQWRKCYDKNRGLAINSSITNLLFLLSDCDTPFSFDDKAGNTLVAFTWIPEHLQTKRLEHMWSPQVAI